MKRTIQRRIDALVSKVAKKVARKNPAQPAAPMGDAVIAKGDLKTHLAKLLECRKVLQEIKQSKKLFQSSKEERREQIKSTPAETVEKQLKEAERAFLKYADNYLKTLDSKLQDLEKEVRALNKKAKVPQGKVEALQTEKKSLQETIDKLDGQRRYLQDGFKGHMLGEKASASLKKIYQRLEKVEEKLHAQATVINGCDLRLLLTQPGDGAIKANTLYLYRRGESLEYVVKEGGKAKIVTGEIKAKKDGGNLTDTDFAIFTKAFADLEANKIPVIKSTAAEALFRVTSSLHHTPNIMAAKIEQLPQPKSIVGRMFPSSKKVAIPSSEIIEQYQSLQAEIQAKSNAFSDPDVRSVVHPDDIKTAGQEIRKLEEEISSLKTRYPNIEKAVKIQTETAAPVSSVSSKHR